MTMTDPIADFLTRIRNALLAKHETTEIPASKLKWRLAEILKTEGYITDARLAGEGRHKVIRISLKYAPGEISVIQSLQRISKPGRRMYVTTDHLPRVLDGLGMAVISTSRGVMSDRECRRLNIGGEVMCQVW
ncbi:MAG: 30S ribosomal protein S8 [Candidatus Entotheonellia bacterium]